MSDAQDEQTHVSLEGVPGVLTRQAWDGRVLVRMATTEQEDEFARRYSAQGAKTAALPERGVWVDLARFDYHFVDHREFENMMGSMSEGAIDFYTPSRETTQSHSMLKPTPRRTRLVVGRVTRLAAYLVSLFVSTQL